MKICLSCDYTGPAKDSMGAERMIEALAVSLRCLGYEVVMHVRLDSVDMPAPVVSEIPKDCDIINFNGWIPGESEIKYPTYGIPWVVTLHGGGTENDPRWLKSIKNPHMICVSKFIADRIGTKAYVWAGANPDNLSYVKDKQNYFLWLAGTDWGEGKGLFTAIRLAKKLRFNLKIAGGGKNQEIINEIKKHCDDKIEYVGMVNGKEKRDLLAYAKAFLLLTRLPDACPLTFSESMLSGTPVITFPNGCMPELMTEKVGFICENDVDFAKAIVKINQIKPEDCFYHGIKNFSNLAMAGKYVQFYENMIKYGHVEGDI